MAQVHNPDLVGSAELVSRVRNNNGEWMFGVVAADPNGVVPGELGDLVLEEPTGTIWKNSDGATAWVQLGAAGGDAWLLQGNTGTSPLGGGGTDFVGTTDGSGLSIGTGTAERVGVSAGGTVTVSPDGVNDRVTITDVDTTIRHVDATGNDTIYAGPNLLGFGLAGTGMTRDSAEGLGALFTYQNPGETNAGVIATDPGFAAQAGIQLRRVHLPLGDNSQVRFNTNTVAGATAVVDIKSNLAGTAIFDLRATEPNGNETQIVGDAATAGPLVQLRASSVSNGSKRLELSDTFVRVEAGDRASNAINGDDLEVLARYGTGTSEVRFTPRSEIRGTGYVEQRGVAAAGVETISHNLDVPVSALGDWPVLIQIIDDATNQVVIPSTIQFINSDTVNIGFAASGTYRIYVSALAG